MEEATFYFIFIWLSIGLIMICLINGLNSKGEEIIPMMKLIDFINMYSGKENDYTKVIFEWYWTDTGIDEEYCFEGKPSEFYEKYTKDYKVIEGVYMNDLTDLSIKKDGRIEIYAKIVQD